MKIIKIKIGYHSDNNTMFLRGKNSPIIADPNYNGFHYGFCRVFWFYINE